MIPRRRCIWTEFRYQDFHAGIAAGGFGAEKVDGDGWMEGKSWALPLCFVDRKVFEDGRLG
jgi:hypothetical protein